MTVLDDIIQYKKEEVAAEKSSASLSSLEEIARARSKPRGFLRALEKKAAHGAALIAEIKKASPSKGLIRADFRPSEIASAYEAGGATCLSVLTDKPSFQGAPEFLREASAACRLPVLRKDFMIDPYQVVQARAWGADCILLIMACLSTNQARELEDVALDHGMDVLVECHNEQELKAALSLRSRLIGVNNRDLRTFEVTLKTTVRLAAQTPPDRLLTTESGISSARDIAFLRANGAKAFLVGESLMRANDIEQATRRLLAADSPIV